MSFAPPRKDHLARSRPLSYTAADENLIFRRERKVSRATPSPARPGRGRSKSPYRDFISDFHANRTPHIAHHSAISLSELLTSPDPASRRAGAGFRSHRSTSASPTLHNDKRGNTLKNNISGSFRTPPAKQPVASARPANKSSPSKSKFQRESQTFLTPEQHHRRQLLHDYVADAVSPLNAKVSPPRQCHSKVASRSQSPQYQRSRDRLRSRKEVERPPFKCCASSTAEPKMGHRWPEPDGIRLPSVSPSRRSPSPTTTPPRLHDLWKPEVQMGKGRAKEDQLRKAADRAHAERLRLMRNKAPVHSPPHDELLASSKIDERHLSSDLQSQRPRGLYGKGKAELTPKQKREQRESDGSHEAQEVTALQSVLEQAARGGVAAAASPGLHRILAALANSGDGQMMGRPDEADHWHGHDKSSVSPETDITESSMSWPVNSFTMRENTLYESLKNGEEAILAAQCMQQSVPELADNCKQQPEMSISTQDRHMDPCGSPKALLVSTPSIDGCATVTTAPAQEGGEKQVEPIAIYDGETKEFLSALYHLYKQKQLVDASTQYEYSHELQCPMCCAKLDCNGIPESPAAMRMNDNAATEATTSCDHTQDSGTRRGHTAPNLAPDNGNPWDDDKGNSSSHRPEHACLAMLHARAEPRAAVVGDLGDDKLSVSMEQLSALLDASKKLQCLDSDVQDAVQSSLVADPPVAHESKLQPAAFPMQQQTISTEGHTLDSMEASTSQEHSSATFAAMKCPAERRSIESVTRSIELVDDAMARAVLTSSADRMSDSIDHQSALAAMGEEKFPDQNIPDRAAAIVARIRSLLHDENVLNAQQPAEARKRTEPDVEGELPEVPIVQIPGSPPQSDQGGQLDPDSEKADSLSFVAKKLLSGSHEAQTIHVYAAGVDELGDQEHLPLHASVGFVVTKHMIRDAAGPKAFDSELAQDCIGSPTDTQSPSLKDSGRNVDSLRNQGFGSSLGRNETNSMSLSSLRASSDIEDSDADSETNSSNEDCSDTSDVWNLPDARKDCSLSDQSINPPVQDNEEHSNSIVKENASSETTGSVSADELCSLWASKAEPPSMAVTVEAEDSAFGSRASLSGSEQLQYNPAIGESSVDASESRHSWSLKTSSREPLSQNSSCSLPQYGSLSGSDVLYSCHQTNPAAINSSQVGISASRNAPLSPSARDRYKHSDGHMVDESGYRSCTYETDDRYNCSRDCPVLGLGSASHLVRQQRAAMEAKEVMEMVGRDDGKLSLAYHGFIMMVLAGAAAADVGTKMLASGHSHCAESSSCNYDGSSAVDDEAAVEQPVTRSNDTWTDDSLTRIGTCSLEEDTSDTVQYGPSHSQFGAGPHPGCWAVETSKGCMDEFSVSSPITITAPSPLSFLTEMPTLEEACKNLPHLSLERSEAGGSTTPPPSAANKDTSWLSPAAVTSRSGPSTPASVYASPKGGKTHSPYGRIKRFIVGAVRTSCKKKSIHGRGSGKHRHHKGSAPVMKDVLHDSSLDNSELNAPGAPNGV